MHDHTIYRTTAKGGIDAPIAEITAVTPVAALEDWAARCDFADYSIDETGLAYWLCPAHSQFLYYTYRDSVVSVEP